MLKKYPFVKQTGIKDCGVACLQMIIRYYQGYLSMRKLQDMTKTTKNGTTAFHIIEAAKQIGFEASGVKADLKAMNDQNMILPCIANVTINNTYNHYVVIYEINYRKKFMIIADPSSGIKKMPFNEFEKIWNNIILFMYPITKLPLYTKEPNLLEIFINIIIFYKKFILHITIISCFYTIFLLLSSYYFKFITDSVLTQSKNYMIFLFILFAMFNGLKNLSNYCRNKLQIYLSEKIDLLFTSSIFKSIILLPYNYYRNHTTGEIVSRMNDLGKIREIISKIIISVFIDLPIAFVSFIVLYFINSTLFFISSIIIILFIIIASIFTKFIKRNVENAQIKRAEYTSYMVESITGFESVKGLSMEKNVIDKFQNKYINYLKKIFSLESIYNNSSALKQLLFDIGSLCVLFVGGLLIIDGKLTLGNLLVFNTLLNYLLLPIDNAIEYNISIREANNALKRILEIIVEEETKGNIDNKIYGDITVKNLNYSYNDRDYVLKNVNLDIRKKEKIVFIGDSGSGKSTLVKLLLQYYPLSRNKIYIDNVDINDYRNNCIKNNIVYISQNETLFTDTLYNNITLDEKIDNDKFLEITKICHVDNIIKTNNLGYNMLIEENGFNLSGGEKQRIVLARSLMRNFEILIIDEGLNQVDTNLERKILKNILTKFSNKTIIFISHRLDNIDLFNHLVEFSNHKIKRNIYKTS